MKKNIVDNSVANISAVGSGMIPVCPLCNVNIEYDKMMKSFGERKRANYRGISQLSVVQKVFGGIFIERIRISIDSTIGEEHCGFREESGCFDFCCLKDM